MDKYSRVRSLFLSKEGASVDIWEVAIERRFPWPQCSEQACKSSHYSTVCTGQDTQEALWNLGTILPKSRKKILTNQDKLPMRISSHWVATALSFLYLSGAVEVKYFWRWHSTSSTRMQYVTQQKGREVTDSMDSFMKYLSEERDPEASPGPNDIPDEYLFSLGTLNCSKSRHLGALGPEDSNAVNLVVSTMLTGLYDVLCVQRVSLANAKNVVDRLRELGHMYDFKHVDEIADFVGPNDKLCIFYHTKYLSPLSHFVTDPARMRTRAFILDQAKALIREGYIRAVQEETAIQGMVFRHFKSNRLLCVQNVLLKRLSSQYFSFDKTYDVLDRAGLKNADLVHYSSIKNARMYASSLNTPYEGENMIHFMAGDFRITDSCIAHSYLFKMMGTTRFSYLVKNVTPLFSDGNVGLYDTRVAFSLASPCPIQRLVATKPTCISNETIKRNDDVYDDWGIDICARTDQIFYGSLCMFDITVAHFQIFQAAKRDDFKKNRDAYTGIQLGRGFVFVIGSRKRQVKRSCGF